MPIYEYECNDCGEIEEVLQKFSDKPPKNCKKCSGNLHKLISQNSFHLKGSGWYVTDYAKKASSCAGQPKSKPESSKKPDAGSNSKVEAKAENKKD